MRTCGVPQQQQAICQHQSQQSRLGHHPGKVPDSACLCSLALPVAPSCRLHTACTALHQAEPTLNAPVQMSRRTPSLLTDTVMRIR